MVHIKYIHLNLWRNIGLITEKGRMHITGIGILDKIMWGKKLKFHPNINFMCIFYVDDNDDELDAKHICVI